MPRGGESTLASLHLQRDVLKVSSGNPLEVLGAHVGVHVPNHDDHPVFLALEAVHPVVVAAVPRDHLPLLPSVGVVGDNELGALQAFQAEVDVQDVVRGPAVGLDVGALLHLDDHDLLVLVRSPWQARLRREVLLQDGASLWEDGLALVGEGPPVVEQHAVPLPLVVEKPVGVLEAAVLLVPQCQADLLADGLEVVLKDVADGEIGPRLARPDQLAAQAADPDLRGVLEVVPGHGLSRGVAPALAVPRHGRHLVEKRLRLLHHPCVLQLERRHLRVQRHAPALELRLLVEVVEALLVPHELVCVLQARHDKVVVTGGAVEDVLHRVQVEEQVRHVLQLPEVFGGGEDVLDAVQCQLAGLGVVLVLDVRAQLRDARMPELPLLAVKLPVGVREKGVLALLVAAVTRGNLDVRGTRVRQENDGRQHAGDE
mmetsp:Transcript_12790/g.40341  ORF Transcript_12790/g.40341 Transcript_12790/m.40341 type:complete len:428 (+) Transcript_12790:69-1352(+)